MATPTGLHTRICKFLTARFRRYFATQNLTLVATTITGVRTEQDTSRVPDVVVCTQSLWDNVCARTGSAVLEFEEKPLLVVEVTSENWRDDYIRKRAEYDPIDIPEYWIVDPKRSRLRVCSNIDNEVGYSARDFLPGQEVRSPQFPELTLPVDRLLSPPVVEALIRRERSQRQQLERQVNAERQRAERLAQRLRELGIDPDAIER